MRAISCCFIGVIWREREPPSCWAAMRAWWRVVASMRSWTASAWVRSRRPERKARWVNSPGSARRAPAAMALAEEVVEEDGGAVGGYLYDVFGGVRVGAFEEGDDGFVEDLACVVKDFGEAGLGGGEGVAEFEERFGDGAGGGAGEADDADASAAGWGGDGDDGVVFDAHGFYFFRLSCRFFSGVAEWRFYRGFCVLRVRRRGFWMVRTW